MKLLDALPRELQDRFTSFKGKVTPILPYSQLPNYTDHGVTHICNVQENLVRLIPEEMPHPLTSYEVFILLCSSLLHDVGMMLSKTANESSKDIRIDHYNRSKDFVCSKSKELGLSEHEAQIIGEICRAHGMPDLKYLENSEYSISKYGSVRVSLLSAFLRLADILDITVERAPLMVSESRKMDKESLKHWNVHQCISDIQIKTSPLWDLRIFAIPKKKSDESALYELQNTIQSEVDTLYPVLRSSGIYFKKVELIISPIPSEKEQKNLKNPFLRLASFDSKHTDRFAGRDEEVQKVVELIVSRKLVVLIGESGVGKTSIVNAGVVPKIKDFKTGIVRFSLQNEPVNNLLNELHDFCEKKKNTNEERITKNYRDQDLLSFIQSTLKKCKKNNSKLLIIGDHLEQMFTTERNSKARINFIEQMSRVLGNQVPVTFLFCIREDYSADLFDLSKDIPEFYATENTFRLHRLDREKGRKAIERASQSARVELSNNLIEKIVEDLCYEGGGMIYPPFLQIVGYSFYKRMEQRGFHAYESQENQKFLYEHDMKGANEIISDYFDSLLDHYLQEDKPVVGEILKEMVSEHRTKKRVTKKYLVSVLSHCHDLDKLLDKLVQDRIVRRSLGEYELIHDFLAKKVIEVIEEKRFLSLPVRKSSEYIEENYSKIGLTSSEIAKSAGVTQMHLATLFSKQLNSSINKQLNTKRIVKAKELLGNGLENLSIVAEKTGFKSLSSFSRKFKEIDGSSPLSYRNDIMEKKMGRKKRTAA